MLLFWVKIIAGHEADGAFKAKNTDVTPSYVAIFAIQVANSYFRRPFGQVDLLNCTGPTFESC